MKWGMFITSYVPLYFILIIKHIDTDKLNFTLVGIKSFFAGSKTDVFFWSFIIIAFIMSIITLLTFKFVFTRGGSLKNLNLKISDISNLQDSEMSYLLTYVVPLASINNTEDSKAMITNLILFILIGLMYTKNNLIYLNPAFSIVGYTVFKASQKVYITKISRTEMNNIVLHKEEVFVSELGDNVYYLRKNG